MNINELQDTMSSLKKGGLRITDSHGGHISGTITLQKDQKEIMTSIPYDKGWTIRVDGKKVKYTKYADTFIQFPCSSGQHKITMQYVSPGFYSGLFVGGIGFLLALVYFGWERLAAGKWKKIFQGLQKQADDGKGAEGN